jgi:assimilatory nitrate reductase catalytic subunit
MGATIRTTCPYCGVGCGVLASHKPGGDIEVKGDPGHPANFGRLCSKGSALGETLSLDDRLLYPMVRGERTSWDAALEEIARRFGQTIDEHGPDAVAFYVSGQLLTEDYYVANKLMKGFIGSGNIDTNSRLCMASAVAGHRRAFGADTVPGTYEDLELADLVVLVGSNLAWCHPVLFQRLAAAREARGTKVVVIDPRRTATCDIADLHLALAPGSDVALFNGLFAHLAEAGKINDDYVSKHTEGFEAALVTARAGGLATVARETGLSEAELRSFYRLFADTPRVVTAFSQGVNQSSRGTDKVNAIINCHLATGRIGRPGMGPFSVTGQPNAMGGREVGGLANQLAAHMAFEAEGDRALVRRFWDAPRLAERAGLKAVDMFDAVADGRIKAIWIMATNPVDSLPVADRVRAALRACPLVIVSDVTARTDTAELAHILLPAAAWGEKDGTVTNSERRISRQRTFLPPPGEARADWWALTQVARRMGFAAQFPYEAPHEIFAEHAALSAFENEGSRDFDIGALASLSAAEFDALEPVQWPKPRGSRNHQVESRFFADGGFFTATRRGHFIPTPVIRTASQVSDAFPMVLNTGRIRDQWHTMTRTAKSARLLTHIAEPFAEIHPDDAARLGIGEAGLVAVESAHGGVVLRALITSRQRRGMVFAPIHWTDQLASAARVGSLVAPHTDPVSGQPELKFTAVRVSPFAAGWYGFAVSTQAPAVAGLDYWVVARAKTGFKVEFALCDASEDWAQMAARLLGTAAQAEVEILAYHDGLAGRHRFAAFAGGRMVGALFLDRAPVGVSRSWLAGLIGQEMPDRRERLRVLAGRPASVGVDAGAIVCACLEVGINQILRTITQAGCHTVAAVGAACGAGTNCGSCRPEIGKLIQERVASGAS